MNKDVLFIFTNKYYGMILDCRKLNQDQYEILTKCHGLLKVNQRRKKSSLDDIILLDLGYRSTNSSTTIMYH